MDEHEVIVTKYRCFTDEPGSMDEVCSESSVEFGEETEVDLGFAEPVKSLWQLHRCFFPSKIGGKPSWLNPKNLPTLSDIECVACSKPLSFLVQIYAPDENFQHAFHRTIFVFCCKSDSCYKNSSGVPIKVFRCQLPKKNEYYPEEAPNYEDKKYISSIKTSMVTLCDVCGCRGPMHCSRCKKVNYCSKFHQTLHWKYHKKVCSENFSPENAVDELNFPTFEVVMEPERSTDRPESMKKDELPSSTASLSATDLEQFANAGNKADTCFIEFKEKMDGNYEQILRYHKNGEPLWCAADGKLKTEDIPNCEYCGCKRIYEFQIMPQLLNYLNVDDGITSGIDWGIISIYTCKDNCEVKGNGYTFEFAHIQYFSDDSNKS